MKPIQKKSYPPLDEFSQSFEGPWEAKSWDKLPQEMKPKLKKALLEEQGGVCCYCEIQLNFATQGFRSDQRLKRCFGDKVR